MKSIIILVAVVLATPAFAVTVDVSADGNVKSHFVNINYGPHVTFQSGFQWGNRGQGTPGTDPCCTPHTDYGWGENAEIYRGVVYFDLSAFDTIIGDAVLELMVREAWVEDANGGYSDHLQAHAVPSSSSIWRDEEGNGLQFASGTNGATGFTWNNFGGGMTDCDDLENDPCGGEARMAALLAPAPISSISLDFAGATQFGMKVFPAETISMPIPNSVVQGWMDDPSSNAGLMLTVSRETGTAEADNNRVEFVAREDPVLGLPGQTKHAPRLVFEVPEPATAGLLIAGLLVAGARARR
ncbi:MAG: hypothetical protein CMJ18_27200 [Phycisphaeraceae bacterium]|nr:hypothetical protein [Phycisphaeraceae bacterium]